MVECYRLKTLLLMGEPYRSFMRVKTSINIKKPIPTGCWIPRNNLPTMWVNFKFEMVQGYCYKCGIIGHEKRQCGRDKVMAPNDPTMPKYGPNLSCPTIKAMDILLQELDQWKKIKAHDKKTGNRALEYMPEGAPTDFSQTHGLNLNLVIEEETSSMESRCMGKKDHNQTNFAPHIEEGIYLERGEALGSAASQKINDDTLPTFMFTPPSMNTIQPKDP